MGVGVRRGGEGDRLKRRSELALFRQRDSTPAS